MFADTDLRALAEMSVPERAFLSVFLAKPSSTGDLEKRFRKIRRVLSGKGEDMPSSSAEKDERDLWERIRAEYMKGGLGAAGLDEVLAAAREGRIDSMIVDRTFKPEGRRCRECERLEVGAPEKCGGCGSESLFTVDLVNEIVEMLEKTGATVDFADPMFSLTEAGGIAALLRYRV